MAFNDFRKTKDEPKVPATTAGGVGALTAFIDQGSEFSGKLNFKDTVRIDGRFEGEIASENTLIVGESGSVTATIKSQTVIISGEVHGDINATGQVVLHKTARVDGNIHSPRLAMEDGAMFTGRVEMGVGKSSHSKPAAAQPHKDGAPKDPHAPNMPKV
jgi:cytoskeletal protein CcmA (bactofilin family)